MGTTTRNRMWMLIATLAVAGAMLVILRSFRADDDLSGPRTDAGATTPPTVVANIASRAERRSVDATDATGATDVTARAVDSEHGALVGHVIGSGAPLERAAVEASLLSRFVFGNLVLRDRETLLGPVATDANGRFRFGGLEPGTYGVTARHDGFAPPSEDASADGWVVDAGRTTDCGDVMLVEAATLRGVTRDEHGRAIAGVHLQLCQVGRETVSGADGAFEFTDLRADWDALIAQADGFLDAMYPRVIRIRPGEAQSITMILSRGLEVPGRVVDDRGRPVAEVDVVEPFELSAHDARQDFAMNPGTKLGATGADGRFTARIIPDRDWTWISTRTFEGAPNGTSFTSLFRPPYPPVLECVIPSLTEIDLTVVDAAGEAIEPATIAVDVGGARTSVHEGDDDRACCVRLDVGHYQLRLRATGACTLEVAAPEKLTSVTPLTLGTDPERRTMRVTLERDPGRSGRVHGQVLDSDSTTPIASARVTLEAADESGPPFARRTAATDRAGRFAFTGVPDRSFRLEVTHPTRNAARVGQIRGGPIAGDVELRIVFPRGAALHGIVKRVDGRPANHVVVFAGVEGERWLRSLSRDDGSYRVSLPYPGDWIASLAPAQMYSSPKGVIADHGIEVTVADGEDRALDLDLAGLGMRALRGEVRIAAARSERSSVALRDAETGAIVGADGRFDLEPISADSTLAVLRIGDDSVETRAFDFAAGPIAHVVFDTPLVPIRGRVLDGAGGLPLDGARVSVERRGDSPGDPRGEMYCGQRFTDANGAFEFVGFEPGVYYIAVRFGEGDDAMRWTAERELRLGEPAAFEVALGKRGAIVVTLVGGDPAARYSVIATRSDDPHDWQSEDVTPNADTRLEDLIPGRWTVRLERIGENDARAPVGAPSDVDVPAAGEAHVAFDASMK